jgi:3',5'-cyclic AMP phosphodiesterase CpdA
MFTIGHISDPHLALVERPGLVRLLNKRITGYLNMVFKRGHTHQDWALELVVKALKGARPDHIAVTGDVVNLGLPSEFERARAWLKSLGDPRDVSLVPGNHDAYVPGAFARFSALWQPYMQGDAGPAPGAIAWPWLRQRGPVALIGVSSAVATPPFNATGKIGAEQLARLASLLNEMGRQRRCRIVLIHHPPEPVPVFPSKRLRDAAALRDVLNSAGAELVLHGHNHTDTLCFTPGPLQPIPVVGIPSASATGLGIKPAAQYNLYHVSAAGDRWALSMRACRLDPAEKRIETVYERPLIPE